MDIVSAKFLFLGLIALVVLGPDKLPGVLRTGGRLLTEFRRLADQVQLQGHAVLDQAGVTEPLAELAYLGRTATEPLRAVRSELVADAHSDRENPQPATRDPDEPVNISSPARDHARDCSVEAPHGREPVALVWP